MAVQIGNMAGYEAALRSAAYVRLNGAGYLRIAGPDRAGFVQRQTSNDVELLAPGKAVPNVLTSPTARIMDVWTMFAEEDALALLTIVGRAPTTAGFLKSRIFFMDHVTVEDASAEVAQIVVEGPAAGALLEKIGVARVPGPDEVGEAEVGGAAVRVVGMEGLNGPGWRLLVAADEAQAVIDALETEGAAALAPAAYETLRIEAGQPGPAELNEDYTPLEIGLNGAVSSTKGCYTGQEILARQITYDKVTQQLVGLWLGGPAAAGMDVRAEGRRGGTVTSVAESPRLGWIALAVVRRPHHAWGTAVSVGDGPVEIPATVSGLPFAPRQHMG